MNSIKFFFAVLFLVPSLSFAQIAVISDIDDTIKEAHILDTFDKIKLAMQIRPFPLMSELYRNLDSHEVDYFYVSNALNWLMGAQHEKFVKKNNFPDGPLALREGDKSDFKLRAIRKIINQVKPKVVIFFGDNGEKDPYFYHQITQEYSQSDISFVTFIRMAYDYELEGSRLAPGQEGFASAGELALRLMELGFLDQDTASKMVEAAVDVEMPEWVDCSQHRSDLGRFYGLSPFVREFEHALNNRCSTKPVWVNPELKQ